MYVDIVISNIFYLNKHFFFSFLFLAKHWLPSTQLLFSMQVLWIITHKSLSECHMSMNAACSSLQTSVNATSLQPTQGIALKVLCTYWITDLFENRDVNRYVKFVMCQLYYCIIVNNRAHCYILYEGRTGFYFSLHSALT